MEIIGKHIVSFFRFPQFAKRVGKALGFAVPISFFGQLLPWNTPLLSFCVLLLACVCLTLLWKVLFGLVVKRWIRTVGLVGLPLILVGLLVFYSFRPYLLNRDRQYIAVLTDSTVPFNPIKFCSSVYKVDSDSRLIIANHPAHWWAARITANFNWRDIIFLDDYQKRQHTVVDLTLGATRFSNGTDASGARFDEYRIPISERGLWTLRSEISQSTLNPVDHPSYVWHYGIGYAPGGVTVKMKAVERDDAFAWRHVVARRTSVKYFHYIALLSEYLTGRWDSDSRSARKKLLEFTPNDRELLRILTLDLLVNIRVWQGNLLQVQCLPQLRRCETLVRQQEMTDTKDQLISWALDQVVRETDKMGPSFRKRLDDLRPISQSFNLANQPQYPDLTFNDSGLESKLKGLAMVQSSRQSFLHKGNFDDNPPLDSSPSWIMDLAKFSYSTLANQEGVPQSIDGTTARDPEYRKIYWASVIERWTINSMIELMRPLLGEANAEAGSTGSVVLETLEAILKIRKDAVQLAVVGEELGVKEVALAKPLNSAFQVLYSLKDLHTGDFGQVVTDTSMLPNRISVTGAGWLDDTFRMLEGKESDEEGRKKISSKIETMILDCCEDDPGTVVRWQSVLKDPFLHPLLAKLTGFLCQKSKLRSQLKVGESNDFRRISDFALNCFEEIMGNGPASAAMRQVENYVPSIEFEEKDNAFTDAAYLKQLEDVLASDLSINQIFKYACQEARRYRNVIKPVNDSSEKSILGILMQSLNQGFVDPMTLDWRPSPEQRMVKLAIFFPFYEKGGDVEGFSLIGNGSQTPSNDLFRSWPLELGRSQTTEGIGGGYPLTAECLAYSMIVQLDEKIAANPIDELPFLIFYNVVGITPREYVEGIIADQTKFSQ